MSVCVEFLTNQNWLSPRLSSLVCCNESIFYHPSQCDEDNPAFFAAGAVVHQFSDSWLQIIKKPSPLLLNTNTSNRLKRSLAALRCIAFKYRVVAQKHGHLVMDFKIFSDSVHGFMSFHPLVVVVIDTPQVQRLRNIKQLGACYFVFPSASHNRFEHSLGAAFLAGKLFDNLKQKRRPSDVKDDFSWEKKKLCAQIAGLCHDLGHGPFSHLWEHFRKRQGIVWEHEKESILIFDELLKEKISPTKKFSGVRLETVEDAFTFYGLTESDIEIIKKMILGQREKNYIFQVICNKTNNIDVDKWEYITRDSFMLNVPTAFDFKRLLDFSCILQNEKGEEQICFREKECSVLVDMFLARGKLHDTAYQHTKVKIIEEMIIDAFLLANDRLKLTTTPITKLTDHIYQKILYEDFDGDNKMRMAKEILNRVESRQLYKCLAQESLEDSLPDVEKIKAHLSTINGIDLFIDDIKVTYVIVHMTRSNKKEVLKNVSVYEKDEKDGEKYTCKPFVWSNYNNFLKPNLKNLKRLQILLLYKGKEEFPNFLQPILVKELKQALVNQTLG